MSSAPRPPARRWLLAGALALLAPVATAQVQPPEPVDESAPLTERLKALDDPESLKAKLEKKAKPPLEIFRSQVAPFDATPYIKAHHWSTLALELRANQADYDGLLRTAPVPLLGMPQAMTYGREARLVKEQQSRLGFQVMIPWHRSQLDVDLLRPDAIRPDMAWPANLLKLEPHQMLVTVLAREPGDYMPWRRMRAVLPPSRLDTVGTGGIEDRLYYRLVIPLEATRPMLSAHPLTWTTTSHVLWDGLPPESLNPGQQQALVDWLHWGGQLVVAGGAGRNLATLRESFLGRYLPADPTGEAIGLTQADLQPMADAYPPPWKDPAEGGDAQDLRGYDPGRPTNANVYLAPVPIRPPPGRPAYLTGLAPREGATPLRLGEGSKHLLGAEWRVGRGRVTLLAINPTEPTFANWPGLDTFVRRVVLRRREEVLTADEDGFRPLAGPDLTWVRYLSRDLDAKEPGEPDPNDKLPRAPVAAWLDSAGIPSACRSALEDASGISIPGRPFVLRVILLYSLCLVPLNWLVCRYILSRRELAWVVVPLLALGFAVAVERGAANEQGFDSASDEIDLLEIQGAYPRAHLSRFAALYSTGRVRYAIRYPGDLDALALPLNTEGGLKGDEVSQSTWSSAPVPTLSGFSVQPRSLAMFRAEQMVDLRGTITLTTPQDAAGRILNRTDLELRDAAIVEPGADPVPLGTIPPGGSVEVGGTAPAAPAAAGWTDRGRFLKMLQAYSWGRPEDQGEKRLVAWVDGARRGQVIEPAVDRARGLTLVVAHLRHGPPPGPDGPPYAPTGREKVAGEMQSRGAVRP